MNEHPLKSLLAEALSGLDSICDVNTIVGEAVDAPNGTTIIPVSKVSLGFGVGGSDFGAKNASAGGSNLFGGGGGGGVTIEPVAFLVVSGSNVKLLNVKSEQGVNLLDFAPMAMEAVNSLLKKDKKENEKCVEKK